MALMHEPTIAGSNVTGVYSEQRVLGELAEAFFQRFKVDISLQWTELAVGVDVDVVEIAVRRARQFILGHVAIADAPAAQCR